MAAINYNIENVSNTAFDVVLDSPVSGLTGANLQISNPSVSVISMTDSGDNLTYNVVCGTLAENVIHNTYIDDGGTNIYTALSPLLNDIVVVLSSAVEMDNSLVQNNSDNYYSQLGFSINYPEEVVINSVSVEFDSEIGLSENSEFVISFEQLGSEGEFLVDFLSEFDIRINPTGNDKIKAVTKGFTSTNGWDENSVISMFTLQTEADDNPRVTINYFDVIGQTNIESVEIETVDSGIFTIRNSRRDEQ